MTRALSIGCVLVAAALVAPSASQQTSSRPPAAATQAGPDKSVVPDYNTVGDQQTAAARPDNVPLEPALKGFIPIPGTVSTVKFGGSARVDAILLCRQYLGWGPKNPNLIAGVERLKKNLPAKGRSEIYYLYYASQVMHFYGGDDWLKVWNPKMRDLLIETQDNSGRPATAGSWPAESTLTGNGGGRHTATCLSLLTLE
jgi:hypothetical protein